MARIVLKVEYHNNGRYTLTQKTDGRAKIDLRKGLFANDNKGEFFPAVARKIAALIKAGHEVSYRDTSLDKE